MHYIPYKPTAASATTSPAKVAQALFDAYNHAARAEDVGYGVVLGLLPAGTDKKREVMMLAPHAGEVAFRLETKTSIGGKIWRNVGTEFFTAASLAGSVSTSDKPAWKALLTQQISDIGGKTKLSDALSGIVQKLG